MQNVVAADWQSRDRPVESARPTAQIDTTVDIVTPENIAFSYQLAGPFRRLGAYVIDVISIYGILIIIAMIWSMVVAPLLMWLFGSFVGFRLFITSQILFNAIWMVSLFALYWFYGGVFETLMNGQTPGKRILGIRVLTTDGHPINGLQAILRNILRLADCFPLLPPAIFAGTFLAPAIEEISSGFFGEPVSISSLGAWLILPTFAVGLCTAVMNRRFQRVGDLVCGTIVVLEERSRLTGVARAEDPRAPQLAALIPPKFQASRGLAKALATYVERRTYFSLARRREIARHLGEPLLRQFNLPEDTSHDLLLCALYHRTFITDRGDAEQSVVQASPLMTQNPVIDNEGITFFPHDQDAGIPTHPIHIRR